MKIVGVVCRIGLLGVMVLWMAACSSGGGGQPASDLTISRQTAEKGGNSSSSDQTAQETHNGDQAGNSDGQGSDHPSNQGNNGSDQSGDALSGAQGYGGQETHGSGSGGVQDNGDGSATDASNQSEGSENPSRGEEFPIVTVSDRQQGVRTVYQSKAKRFLAVWNNFSEEVGWQVYGRVLNTQGGSHGSLKAVSPSGVERRTLPGIAHDPDTGRSLVVWGMADGDVLGRLIDQDGEPSGPVITVANSASGEVEPVVGFEATSRRYVVAWIETSPDFVLYSRVIDQEGGLVGDAMPISEAASGKLDLRMATDDDAGRFLVVWRDYRGQDIYSIIGRMVGPDGLPTSDEIVIADAVGSQINPELAYDASDRSFFVTWSDSRRSGAYELFGQVVASPDGLLVGSNVLLSPYGGYPHAIAVDVPRARCLVVYSKGSSRLYGQYLSSDGVAEGAEVALSTTENGLQNLPDVVVDPSGGGLLAAWTDEREGTPHIFGRALAAPSPSATLPEGCSGFSAPDGRCLGCEADGGAVVDQTCPLNGSYKNHGDYLACVTDAVNALRHEGRIGGACKVNLIAPRARSSVGR